MTTSNGAGVGKDGPMEGVIVGGAQNEVATDEKIEEIFDFLPIVSTLLENMVKSNVAEKPGEAPLRVDVTEKITELKAKIDAAESFLQNLSGGYLSETVQEEEFKALQEVLKKKTAFYDKCKASREALAQEGAIKKEEN